MTLEEFKAEYFPKSHVCEMTDREEALSSFKSKCSCCWGNKIYPGTGWAVVAQPSAQRVGDKRTVFVCKEELLKEEEHGFVGHQIAGGDTLGELT